MSNCLLLVKTIHLGWISCSQLLQEPFSVEAEVGVGQLLQIQFSGCWKKSKLMGWAANSNGEGSCSRDSDLGISVQTLEDM